MPLADQTTSLLSTIRTHFGGFRDNTILHNIVALSGTQVAALAFPLITVPYLARVLGPYHWGLVALAQAFGMYVAMLVEFGFQLSATRQVAHLRDQGGPLGQLFADVMAAKLLLTSLCLIVILVLQQLIPRLQQHNLLIWAGVASGVAQGFNMLWYYQGMERMKISSAVDVAGKAVAAVGVFIFVHGPTDAWRVLGLQCVGFLGATIILIAAAYSDVAFCWPRPVTTWNAIRDSAAMFLFRSAVSLYTTANALLLGAVASPAAVGFYSGAEKLTKAPLALLSPVSQSLYPRLCRLIETDRAKAAGLARTSLALMAGVGGLLCMGFMIAAPLLVRVGLGPGYEKAIPVVRILSLLLPLVAVSNVLGIQWMLPLRMDKPFNQIIISAGVVNLLLAYWWASRWQYIGMAAAVVISELAVTVSMAIVLQRKSLNPLTIRDSTLFETPHP